MVLTRKQKQALDKQLGSRGKILFNGGRQHGYSFIQNYLITKEWPAGKMVHIRNNEIIYSELADAEEVK